MKIALERFLTLTGGSVLFFSPITYAIMTSPCDNALNKNAIHCAFVGESSLKDMGKYIKIKESQNGHMTTGLIFCATQSSHALLNIPQNQWGSYQPGDNVDWQFSQCIDEDCNTSKPLFEDKFTITRAGKLYASSPTKSVEVVLDPSYGESCKLSKTDKQKIVALKNHTMDSTLQTRIDDAVNFISAIPTMLDNTANMLQQMRELADESASDSTNDSERVVLNNQFNLLKDEINQRQQVSTLNGAQYLSGGSVNITIGNYWWNNRVGSLSIPLEATDIQSLNVANLSIVNQSLAMDSQGSLAMALDVVNNAMTIK